MIIVFVELLLFLLHLSAACIFVTNVISNKYTFHSRKGRKGTERDGKGRETGKGRRETGRVRKGQGFKDEGTTLRYRRLSPLKSELEPTLYTYCPIPDLFVAIYYSIHESGKLNEFGYAETQSHNATIKIWSLASDWKRLVTRRSNPKTTTMGLIIHRLPRSKEVNHRHPTQV